MTGGGLLSVEGLTVGFGRDPAVVDQVSFSQRAGEKLALVGESGAGKSLTALSIIGLLPRGCQVRSGVIRFAGEDLVPLPERARNRFRGARIGMVFQEPMSSLHPGLKVGDQIGEAIETHSPAVTRRAVRSRVLDLLGAVGIPDPARRANEHPHTWSGGMRQRAVIAIAIANDPELIIADEPTTALDVTVQAQILALLSDLCDERGASLLLISHDLGVVSQVADRVAVMYAGRIAEIASADAAFDAPRHPYTRGLLLSRPELVPAGARLQHIPGRPPTPRAFPAGCRFHPRCPLADSRCASEVPALVSEDGVGAVACFHSDRVAQTPPHITREGSRRTARGTVVSAIDLSVHFKLGRERVRAVDGVSFQVEEGETLALVGESGCGKTTTARALMRLIEPTSGTVRFRDTDITRLAEAELKPFRRDVQIVFQDPHGSLNPRRTVGQIVESPLRTHDIDIGDRVAQVLEMVGLDADHGSVLPHELSGGQRQRVSIARALVLEPSLIVLDEPVTALDVSIQAQILNLLQDLQDQLGLAYLLIAHDLGVVKALADRVAVMYLGQVIETGPADRVLTAPTHPYTRALLDSVPSRRKKGDPPPVRGEVPDPAAPPSGCRFHPRCPHATAECVTVEPIMTDRVGVTSACHHPIGG